MGNAPTVSTCITVPRLGRCRHNAPPCPLSRLFPPLQPPGSSFRSGTGVSSSQRSTAATRSRILPGRACSTWSRSPRSRTTPSAKSCSVVWELEPGARVLERASPCPSRPASTSPRQLDAFLDAVRWGAASHGRRQHAPGAVPQRHRDRGLPARPGRPRDPDAAGQPADRRRRRASARPSRPGLVDPGADPPPPRADACSIVCPASLQIQWRDQMRDKFGLEFRIVDSELMKELRRSAGIHVNPWTHFPRLITSIDFLKRERPLRLFREVLPAAGRADLPAPVRPADRRRGPQRRALRPRAIRHRLAAHPGDPRARAALRAQAVPHGHAAQRLPGELHGPAGAARQPALRARRAARPRSSSTP